tara:strand:- start:258 stop:755 length:498 start_codon:yes stop_codon:yes gene_type:complete
MSGYIGSKAVNLSTTGADIKGDALISGSLGLGTPSASVYALPDFGTTEGVTAAASGANVLEYANGSLIYSTNTYVTNNTFTTPPAGLWKFTITAGVLTSTPAKIAFEVDSVDYGVGGFDVYQPHLQKDLIIELDGATDVLVKSARSASSGTATIRALRAFGYKVR